MKDLEVRTAWEKTNRKELLKKPKKA